MPDDGYQLAVATCLDAQDAEAVLYIVEGDAFNEPRQNFFRRSWGVLRRLME
jgi:hypothetical protein